MTIVFVFMAMGMGFFMFVGIETMIKGKSRMRTIKELAEPPRVIRNADLYEMLRQKERYEDQRYHGQVVDRRIDHYDIRRNHAISQGPRSKVLQLHSGKKM